jgi:hypothetical protein
MMIAEFVSQHLDEQIRKGKIKPSIEDARDAAAKHFGVSRSTVRDAVKNPERNPYKPNSDAWFAWRDGWLERKRWGEEHPPAPTRKCDTSL